MKPSKHKKNKWQDHLARRAKKEKYPARSVYKLKEIQTRYRVIKKGDHILDLGCAPGSWLLLAAELADPKGRVAGIDRKPVTVRTPDHVRVFEDDILSLDEKTVQAMGKNFQVVLSDMAPATTGRKEVDAARSFDLCHAALATCRDLLNPGGSFVCKIFQGEDFKSFIDSVAAVFQQVKIFKPQSSRKPSKEIYVIGLGKKSGR